MIALSDTCNNFFRKNTEDDDEIDESMQKCWSFAYGMYVHLRTVIDTIKNIRILIDDKNDIDKYYKLRIKEIIDVTNDIVKHPLFKTDMSNSMASQPQTLSIDGSIDIVLWFGGRATKKTLSPEKNFVIVRNYMESIFEKLNKQS